MRLPIALPSIVALLCASALAQADDPAPAGPTLAADATPAAQVAEAPGSPVAATGFARVHLPPAAAAASSAEDPRLTRGVGKAMVVLGLMSAGFIAGGAAATVAANSAEETEGDGPRDTYEGLAVTSFLAGGATSIALVYLLVQRLDEPEPAPVAVVPYVGPSGAGASFMRRF